MQPAGRGSRHDVGNQRLVPTLDREVPVKPIARAPMPKKLAIMYMPIPIGRSRHLIYSFGQILFLESVSVEISACRQQSHHQVGGFHQISAIVDAVERNGLPGFAVDEVWINPVISV